jgi:hypothetical protein
MIRYGPYACRTASLYEEGHGFEAQSHMRKRCAVLVARIVLQGFEIDGAENHGMKPAAILRLGQLRPIILT